MRIALLLSNTAIITGQCPESPCKYRELLAWRMAPLAKASVTGRYKISYGRCLAKSAILTSFEAAHYSDITLLLSPYHTKYLHRNPASARVLTTLLFPVSRFLPQYNNCVLLSGRGARLSAPLWGPANVTVPYLPLLRQPETT